MTTDEPRKASDILVGLETKINQMYAIIKSQDLVIKVLTNKLNTFIETVTEMMNAEEVPDQEFPDQPHVSEQPPERPLPVEINPKGFRRTSRPETFDKQPAPPPSRPKSTGPIKLGDDPDVKTYVQEQQKPVQPKKAKVEPPTKKADTAKNSNVSKIPVQQRIVRSDGKALFMADIEIINSENELEYKTRTNGLGKWQAVLPVGNYKVKIMKQESLSKEKIDIVQDVMVTGTTPTQDLPVLIAK